jgi:hypothetical protein
VVADGPAAGCRAIDVRVWGGLDVRLLPDRALDCGAAWFAGVPLAWISPVGETAVRGDWRASWGGGLVTTCGLRNVGAPSEGFGLHGDLSFQRAGWVGIERTDGEIVVRGTVADAELALEREWRVRAGTGTVSLRDVCRNAGTRTAPAPLLYHVNFGPPFWAPGATIAVGGATRAAAGGGAPGHGVIPRDRDAAAHVAIWHLAPAQRAGEPERVFEHEPAPDRVTVVNDGVGVAVTVCWEGLSRLHQWVDPSASALGIEPANCSVLGRAADRAAGRLPVLEPGEERVTALEIQASSISKETSSE